MSSSLLKFLSNEGLVGRRGRGFSLDPSVIPAGITAAVQGTGSVSAPIAPIPGGIRAPIVGAQPNQRLELAPPVAVELHL